MMLFDLEHHKEIVCSASDTTYNKLVNNTVLVHKQHKHSQLNLLFELV